MAAGLCRQDMSRLYKKPTMNPAFKLCQPLPTLAVALQGKGGGRVQFPATGSDKNRAAATNGPAGGGLISLCKNFAFSNLF